MRIWPKALLVLVLFVLGARLGPLLIWRWFGPHARGYSPGYYPVPTEGLGGAAGPGPTGERALLQRHYAQAEQFYQQELAYVRQSHNDTDARISKALGRLLEVQVLERKPTGPTVQKLTRLEATQAQYVSDAWVLGFTAAVQLPDSIQAASFSDAAVRAARHSDVGTRADLMAHLAGDVRADAGEAHVDIAMGNAFLAVSDPGRALPYLAHAYDLRRRLVGKRHSTDREHLSDAVEPYTTALRELGKGEQAVLVARTLESLRASLRKKASCCSPPPPAPQPEAVPCGMPPPPPPEPPCTLLNQEP